MAKKKYAKYIITGHSPPRPPSAQTRKIEDQKKEGNWVDLAQLPDVNDDRLKGSFFWMSAWAVTLHGTIPVTTDIPHTHDYNEILGFSGTNVNDPSELGGEVEMWLEDEQYIINQSCVIFIPKGMKHCPLKVRRIDRPFLGFATGPAAKNTRTWEEEYKGI